jgi:CRP-like cAMP-binding protein
LVEKRPPTVSVTADTAATVLGVPQAQIEIWLAVEPAFAGRFYRARAVFLSDRLRSTVSHLGYGGSSEDAQAKSRLRTVWTKACWIRSTSPATECGD